MRNIEILAKYYSEDEIKRDEMGRAGCFHGGE
jgi:hypothetical protein